MGMKPGMKMLAMAKTQGGRMGNDHSTHMGGYGREMNERPEMRRRRDSRGRYMEGDEGSRMTFEAPESAYRPWPEPHIPPENNTASRDSNVINIRDYQDKRRLIGFSNEEGSEMRQYGRRYDPDRPQMHYGASVEQESRMGYAESEGHLSSDEAEEWVRGMKSADGKKGGRWTLQEIQKYAGNYGVKDDEVIDFFAVVNALYTDYCKVARKYGFDRMEVWADMAKAFMRDEDARSGKVKAYYECIADHDSD